jgi:hypothetical protein
MHGHDGVVKAGRKTAEGARPYGEAATVHLNFQTTAQHDKAFVAVQVFVRPFAVSHPARFCVVVPDLQPVRLKAHLIRRRLSGQQS